MRPDFADANVKSFRPSNCWNTKPPLFVGTISGLTYGVVPLRDADIGTPADADDIFVGWPPAAYGGGIWMVMRGLAAAMRRFLPPVEAAAGADADGLTTAADVGADDAARLPPDNGAEIVDIVCSRKAHASIFDGQFENALVCVAHAR